MPTPETPETPDTPETGLPPLALRTVSARGLAFHCLCWGETGPLVLLVHGFPDTAHTWDHVGPRVAAAGFRVVAPSTRGIPPTERPSDDRYDTDTLGQDLLALVTALGEERAVLVGHDFGAAAVYAAGGLAPERVTKLVTVAIPHLATLRPRLATLWGARHFLTHRLPGAARRFAAHDHAQIRVLYERWSPGFDWPEREFAAAKAAYRQPGGTEAALAYYRFVTPRVAGGLRKKLPMPALIVGGRTDGVATAADFEASRSRFTGSVEITMLPGGHFLHREHPDAFLAVLLRFLGEGGAAGA